MSHRSVSPLSHVRAPSENFRPSMSWRPMAAFTVFAAALLVGSANVSHAASEVKVVNTPSVTVPSPIPHSRLQEFHAIPVSADSKGTMIETVLDTTGFSHATISIAVEVQGTADEPGMVTATLLPAVPFVLKTFQKDLIKLFPIEAGVFVERSDKIDVFGSQPTVHPLAFPKYYVLFSNSSDRPVKAYLYVNLTH